MSGRRRLPPQLCASCGQPLPKDRPAPPSFVPAPPPPGSDAARVQEIREAIRRRNNADHAITATADAIEGGPVAAERKGTQ